MTKAIKNHGGARKGAGRKPKADEQQLLDLMALAWPVARRKKAVQKMAKEAEAGNVKAYSALMAYAYGKPKELHELTGKDGEPLMQPVADAILKVYGNGGKKNS